MIKKALVLLFLSFELLYAKCYYIDCGASVSRATTATTNALEKEFNALSKQLKEIDKLYNQKEEQLRVNNEIYNKIVLLKKEYLLKLQAINVELDKQKAKQ